ATQREFTETIRYSGDALLTIINDILDFSKIESGRLDLEQEPFSVRECVESALDLLIPRVVEKRLDLLYEVADGVPGMVRGDATSRRILTTVARGWGVIARAAVSGPEALGWIEAGEVFDVAIVDMQMPAMDGVTFTTELRRFRTAAELPVVLLSSIGPRELVQ